MGQKSQCSLWTLGCVYWVTRFGLCFGLANTFDFEGKSFLFLLFVTFLCYILQTVKNSLSSKKNELPSDTQAQGNAGLAGTEEFLCFGYFEENQAIRNEIWLYSVSKFSHTGHGPVRDVLWKSCLLSWASYLVFTFLSLSLIPTFSFSLWIEHCVAFF